MKRLYSILIISYLFGFNYNVKLSPDIIYVGSIFNLEVEVYNLNSLESPIFYDMEIIGDNLNQIQKTLKKNTINYILQPWEAGNISLPNIKVDIKNIDGEIKTHNLTLNSINVISNISNSDTQIKDLKPIKYINLYSKVEIITFIILILLGTILLFYTIKNKSKSKTTKNYYSAGSYNKNKLQITLNIIESISIPNNITKLSSELYYLELSKQLKYYIHEIFYIRATEMTTSEIRKYLNSISLDTTILEKWENITASLDNAKYTNKVPNVNEFISDRTDLINLIKTLNLANNKR